eukprot:747997-Hanusia_phi.AAC.1
MAIHQRSDSDFTIEGSGGLGWSSTVIFTSACLSPPPRITAGDVPLALEARATRRAFAGYVESHSGPLRQGHGCRQWNGMSSGLSCRAAAEKARGELDMTGGSSSTTTRRRLDYSQ